MQCTFIPGPSRSIGTVRTRIDYFVRFVDLAPGLVFIIFAVSVVAVSSYSLPLIVTNLKVNIANIQRCQGRPDAKLLR